MADHDKFKDPLWWRPTTEQPLPQKMAEFATFLDLALTRPIKLTNRVEAVGEGQFLRLRDRTPSIVSPPEGEGDWELPAEDHVGEDTP